MNYNNYQSIIFVMQTWNTTDAAGNPIVRGPWAQAWGGTYTTAEGNKTLAVLVMPHDWSVKPIYATIAHELGSQPGTGEISMEETAIPAAINARTMDG